MDILLSNTDVLNVTLSYLDLFEVSYLDSAITNKAMRAIFITSLQSCYLTLSDFQLCRLNADSQVWASTKGIVLNGVFYDNLQQDQIIGFHEVFKGTKSMQYTERMFFATKIEPHVFSSLFSDKFISLKKIVLDGNDKLTDGMLRIICESCCSLQELNLCFCKQITGDQIRSSSLQVLDLNYCEKVGDAALINAAHNLPSLTTLLVSDCIDGVRKSDNGLRALVELKNLRALEIRYSNITDEGIREITSSLSKITCFDIAFCPVLTASCLLDIAYHLHSLEKLCLSFSLDSSSVSALVSMIHLEYLDIRSDLDDNSFARISSMNLRSLRISSSLLVNCLSSFQNLICLDLAGCSALHEASIIQLTAHSPELRELSLGCLGVTAASVISFTKHCQVLTNLNLSECSLIDDYALEAISLNCLKIVALNLSGCYRATDIGLKSMARTKWKLNSLNIAGLKKVSDIGIFPFLNSCGRHLEILSVSTCPLITNDGLRPLKDSLSLRELVMDKCSLVTDNFFQEVFSTASKKHYLRKLSTMRCHHLTDSGLEDATLLHIISEK